jgi:uronate dehydrogenase
MTKKRILLTGAAGRVGRLVRPLLQSAYALRLCDLASVERLAADDEILVGDLADPAVALRAVDGVAAVVHLAGLVAPAVSFEDTLAPNYRAVLNLLEACRQRGVERFVFASSHHIVGLHAPEAVAADAPLAPDGFYGLSKAFGEAACALYARRFGIRTWTVRIGNADPEVVDGRRERLWVSGRDLGQLLAIGIEHPEVRCEVVYGVSNCPDPFFSDTTASRFGYRPLDHAAEHRAANFRPLAAMTAAEGAGYVGGLFAATELPDPGAQTQ